MNIIQEIEEAWGWIGIKPKSILFENDFGNLIIEDVSGPFWRLSPEDLYCEIVTQTKDELNQLMASEEFQEDWNMELLVKQAKAHLGELEKLRKYYLVFPGPLGGEYAISNIKTAPLSEIISFSGSVAKQIEDLPDGAQIQLRIID